MPTTFLGYKRLEKSLKAQRVVNRIEDILIFFFLLSTMLIVCIADSFSSF